MDQWEALVETFPPDPDTKTFNRMLQKAMVTLKTDLADFELEKYVKTLFHEPISLLRVIENKQADFAWSRLLTESFKLITEIVRLHKGGEWGERYLNEWTRLCLLTYDTHVQKNAFECLITVIKEFDHMITYHRGIIDRLHETSTCKAQLAVLIGTLCEYYPATMSEDALKIFRKFWRLLNYNRNTIVVTKSLLLGLNGFFKYMELPNAELMKFYSKISSLEYLKIPKCQEAVLSILRDHAHLFKEKLAEDVNLRDYLWSLILIVNETRAKKVASTLVSVYSATCSALDKDQIEIIINTELYNKINNRRLIKYTALHIIIYMIKEKGILYDLSDIENMQLLELEVRKENASYECADAIKWCVQAELLNSDKLLQASVLYFYNLPSDKRREVVVFGILTAKDDARQHILTTLITETCLNTTNLETYLPLWEMIFDTNQTRNLRKYAVIFEECVEYLWLAVQRNLDEIEGKEEMPNNLSQLLLLISHLLSYQEPRQYTMECSIVIADCCLLLFRKYGPTVANVTVIVELMKHMQERVPEHIFEYIHVDRCREEALLCASGAAYIQLPINQAQPQHMLTAAEIIFSRIDFDPDMLIKTLNKFEALICMFEKCLDKDQLCRVIGLVEKLRSRNDLVGKEARVLQRNVVMFLGKYFSITCDTAGPYRNYKEIELYKVKEHTLLTLNIPNPTEGPTVYELSIHRILLKSCILENLVTLKNWLALICGKLFPRKVLPLQTSLCGVIYALCRVHSRDLSYDIAPLQYAAQMCNTHECVELILYYLSIEISPCIRRMLFKVLESMLVKDANSAEAEMLLNFVAKEATKFLDCRNSVIRRAGLELSESIIIALRTSPTLTEVLLPTLLIAITKTKEAEAKIAFKAASILFLNRLYLYGSRVICKTMRAMFEYLLFYYPPIRNDTELRAYKIAVKMCLTLGKNVFDNVIDWDLFSFIKKILMDRNNTSLFAHGYICHENMESQRMAYMISMAKTIAMVDDLDREINNEVVTRFFEVNTCTLETNFDFESAVTYLVVFNKMLREIKNWEVYTYISNIICRLHPENVVYLNKTLQSAFSGFRITPWPQKVVISYDMWFNSLPIDDITVNLTNMYIAKEHITVVRALAIMSETFQIKQNKTEEWPMLIFYGTLDGGVPYSELSYLRDCLSASCMSMNFVKELMATNDPQKVIAFMRTFMSVFFDYMVSEPYLLLKENYVLLLNDVVKWCNKRKLYPTHGLHILNLVNKVWPIYALKSDNEQKYILLRDLTYFTVKLETSSPPMQWVCQMLASSVVSHQLKARLIGVLPGGRDYIMTYRDYSAHLPDCFPELDQAPFSSMLRALLDSLARSGDDTLLEIAISLAKSDDAEGWWDEAFDSCAASLASVRTMRLMFNIYKRCYDGVTTGVCKRLMIPILRYSTRKRCEEFFSAIILDLLRPHKRRIVPSNNPSYLVTVMTYVREFTMMLLAFERIPRFSLQSPTSVLYKKLARPQPWHFVKAVCKICVTVRNKVICPEDGNEKITEACRLLQCAAYKCISAALCIRKPAPFMYDYVFDNQVWSSMVSETADYEVPLRSNVNLKAKHHSSAISVSDTNIQPGAVISLTRTVRSRLFPERLSEHSMHYNMSFNRNDRVEETQTEDYRLIDNPMNNHEVTPTLTALFCHMATISDSEWLQILCNALTGSLHKNVKLILAQAAVNAKEQLKKHAYALCPALLSFIVATAHDHDDKKMIDGFHVDVLDAIVYWGYTNMTNHTTNFNKVINYAIVTCFENRRTYDVYRCLSNIICQLCEIYRKHVVLQWCTFQEYFEDDQSYWRTLQILMKITKQKVNIPLLIPKLLSKFTPEYKVYHSLMAEIFGLALAECKDDEIKRIHLANFNATLDSFRADREPCYVKVLYYSQLHCRECCNSTSLRVLLRINANLSISTKNKSLSIMSSYISTLEAPNDDTRLIFASLNVFQMFDEDTTAVEALGLVKSGYRVMDDGLKMQVTVAAVGYCEHPLAKIRKAALEYLLVVFAAMFKTTVEAERSRPIYGLTPLLTTLNTPDAYCKMVLDAVSEGCLDADHNVATLVRTGVAECLYDSDMKIRFAETFLVIILTTIRSPKLKKRDLSNCTSVFLELLFYKLKNLDDFKGLRLWERALPDIYGKPRPSRPYNHWSLPREVPEPKRQHTWNEPLPVDVQIPVAEVLDGLLRFARNDPESANTLCLEMSNELLNNKRGYDLSFNLCKMLTWALAEKVCALTPYLIEQSRMIIDIICGVDGIENLVEKLKRETANTEGEAVASIFFEDVILRRRQSNYFELGRPFQRVDHVMGEGQPQFTIEALFAAFGALSNWDRMTFQERERVKKSTMPILWTDPKTFMQCLQVYKQTFTDTNHWFNAMCCANVCSGQQDMMKVLLNTDKWPRQMFTLSALTEAIYWESKLSVGGVYGDFPCYIRPSDCMVEWAARLMVRSAHMAGRHQGERVRMVLSRTDELKWCANANKRNLSEWVLQCINRNFNSLEKHEVLSWMKQKVIALRNMGLENNNTAMLIEAREIAENYTRTYESYTKPGVVMFMHKLALQIHMDLKSLTKQKALSLIKAVEKCIGLKGYLSTKSRKVLMEFYLEIMVFFANAGETDERSTLINMSRVYGKVNSLALKNNEMFLALMMSKFTNFLNLDAGTCRLLMDRIQYMLPYLDHYFVEMLVRQKKMLASPIARRYDAVRRLQEDERDQKRFKLYLQLINDAQRMLWNYCDDLTQAVKRNASSEWAKVYKNMFMKMFNNPYRGNDYERLNIYREPLRAIEIYTATNAERKLQILNEVKAAIGDAKISGPRRLSQMSPHLKFENTFRGNMALARLLRLPPGLTVLGFEEKVIVFTDSQRHPCLFTVHLSNGTKRRYLHKSGEPLRVDSAALCVQRACNALWGIEQKLYQVTPISGDSGIIEFLEDHSRVHSLVSSHCHLPDFQRPKDAKIFLMEELELMRTQNLNCVMVPSHTLRTAIEHSCVTLEELNNKRRQFLDTLAGITIVNMLLGVGDRHLQNVMYSHSDGSLVCIDWTDLFSYGSLLEPTPGRLTRNMIAVCDLQAFEARLQQMMHNVRTSSRILLPFIKVVFQWMGSSFQKNLPYIEGMIKGSCLSHEVALNVIYQSDPSRLKSYHLDLFSRVFPEAYGEGVRTIEEQVSYLLRHCTDRRFLALARQGWRPWI